MIECVDDQLREVPAKFTVTCADAKEYLNKLTWKGWGHKEARASGVLTIEPTFADVSLIRDDDVQPPVYYCPDRYSMRTVSS